MKILKNQFYQSKHLKNKKSSEEMFYEYYFKADAQFHGLDIKHYKDPLNVSEMK